MEKPEFLKKVKKVHLTGIKGVGMTALACLLKDLKIRVSGSDVAEVFVTDSVLKEKRIFWRKGFGEKNLKPSPDLLITTAAHGGLRNPEALSAKAKGVPVLTHAQALGKLMEGKEGISVCGVGGKSSTSAMLATVLTLSGQKPSYAVGVAKLFPLGFPGHWDEGKVLVAEADEYANSPGLDNRPRFYFQKPKVIIVTNIEFDHPDIYENLAQTKEVFKKFFLSLPPDGLLVANADHPQVREVIKDLNIPCQTYGFSPQADWRVEKISFGQQQTLFDLSYQEALISNFNLKVPGRFNVLNAAAVVAAGTFLGLDAKTIKKSLGDFKGTRRRFEFIGEKGGVKLYDDYAHHPTEIKATLAAAKQWFPGQKIWVVFQPHTYSRTKALFKDFSHAFVLADNVIVTSIYASAREKEDLGVSGQKLAEAISQHHRRVHFFSGEKEAAEFLGKNIRPGEVVFTMGAGDIFLWHSRLLAALEKLKG